MAVNFTKNQDDIIKAWREVVDSTDTQKWALFGYEGTTNNIKLMLTGSRGLDELVQEFNCSLIQYAFCRVLDKELGINKLVLINWQGDSSPLSRKGLCASHVSDVSNYFKGCTQTITIRNDDEATKEYLMEQILKTSASKINLSRQQQQSNNIVEDAPPTGYTYKKTNISSEIASNRKSFWQRQEEEEKERIAEEKRRAAEKQAQFEREQKLREESEAKKLSETIKERDRLIEATRQADRLGSSLGNNQPSSILSTNDATDEDSRVGRRSELIRLERNQETQSLIGKGLIKNKRAIFEQAQQQQQQQKHSHQPTLTRRASGAMIAQRVNTFKSLDSSNTGGASVNNNNDSTNVVGKLTNGFAKQVNLDGDKSAKAAAVKKDIEDVKLTKEDETFPSTITKVESTTASSPIRPKVEDVETNEEIAPALNENSDKVIDISQDVNGNNEHNSIVKGVEAETEVVANDELITNGKHDINAVALYDYQAADNTEISFDPEDIIGCIQKVDPGWWHGKVMSGQYKGQTGLFPANYVQEL